MNGLDMQGRHYVVNVSKDFNGFHLVHFLGSDCVRSLPGVHFLGEHPQMQQAVVAARGLGYFAVSRCLRCDAAQNEPVSNTQLRQRSLAFR